MFLFVIKIYVSDQFLFFSFEDLEGDMYGAIENCGIPGVKYVTITIKY